MDRKIAAAAVGFFIINQGVAGEIVDLPPQAIGALGLSASTSSTSASVAVIQYVPDTTIDKVYEARFARLAPQVEQGPGKGQVPRTFS